MAKLTRPTASLARQLQSQHGRWCLASLDASHLRTLLPHCPPADCASASTAQHCSPLLTSFSHLLSRTPRRVPPHCRIDAYTERDDITRRNDRRSPVRGHARVCTARSQWSLQLRRPAWLLPAVKRSHRRQVSASIFSLTQTVLRQRIALLFR